MTLAELEGGFIRVGAGEPGHYSIGHTDSIANAQGVEFLCPGCYAKNGGPRGTHMVICWFSGRGVPDDAVPLPGRWGVSGTGIGDLTLAPSVDVGSDHCWHGFIQNGQSVG